MAAGRASAFGGRAPVDRHHDVARFSWQAVQPDGVVLIEGLDIAALSREGDKIERIIGFFDPLDTAGRES